MSDFISTEDAVEHMKFITRAITKDTFSLDDCGALIIHATGSCNSADGCAEVTYELLDEDEYYELLEEIYETNKSIPL